MLEDAFAWSLAPDGWKGLWFALKSIVTLAYSSMIFWRTFKMTIKELIRCRHLLGVLEIRGIWTYKDKSSPKYWRVKKQIIKQG